MTDTPRLIEHAFPLKQASLDSVHEKNVRHGHISTLHIWPARRPLAACRAALIATLLPDPSAQPKPKGMSDAQWEEEVKRRRKELCEKIGGRVVKRTEKKKMPNGSVVERIKEETEGGILHWLEEEPYPRSGKKWREWKARKEHYDSTLEWFRQEIRKAYGGRAPKVLDPFAGGGAIPLEAMRLGCEATAIDINPVAWFILKCTLEYPQKLAGQTRPLPEFILHDDDFMREFFLKAKKYSKAEVTAAIKRLHGRLKKKAKAGPAREQASLPFGPDTDDEDGELQADLAWHVRAWGRWVLARARKDLAKFYPTYADFEPLKPGEKSYERQPMQLVPLRDDGTPNIDALNAEFSEDYLAVKSNPRWVAKPTVAYLWARTVKCKNCRATVPLLKTRWLCRKANKRVLLRMEPHADKTGVVFSVEENVPVRGGNAAQRREHDKRIGAGTMSRAGAKCPCCPTIMTMEDIGAESNAGRSDIQLMAVVTEGTQSKEYRSATIFESESINAASEAHDLVIAMLPRCSINEPFAPASTRSISAQGYGVKRWRDLFTARQRVSLATLGAHLQAACLVLTTSDVPDHWQNAVTDAICLSLDRLASFLCVNTRWKTDADSMTDAFSRFSISLLWDFAEANPLGTAAGAFVRCTDRIATAYDALLGSLHRPDAISAVWASADEITLAPEFDVIVTDPPYYQAVSYADLSDFFYTWLRGFRVHELPEFAGVLTEKSKEFVQHIRTDKSREDEKQKYERQMSQAFIKARSLLASRGRFVCVFAHKDPDAWETLVSAIIKAGFVVTGSWPVQTEMPSRQRGAGVAALASSVWLVCRPRDITARPGWDNNVLIEMRRNIAVQLRDFWDAGIHGPNFVWAATGPALEAYSKHPIVKKADSPGEIMTVSEFLTHVRRMVVDFVVGRVLSGDGDAADQAAADKLDEPTAYYLLHRHDFRMEEAPAGTCILYAVSCGLSDRELVDTWDLLARTGGTDSAVSDDSDEAEEADADSDAEEDTGSGSKLKLKTWAQRKGRTMGYEAPGGKPIPLIDRVHRLMHLWKAQDVHKVDEYLDDNVLRRNELFKRLLQSLIELSPHGSDERSLLESLSNHIGAKGAKAKETPEFWQAKDEE